MDHYKLICNDFTPSYDKLSYNYEKETGYLINYIKKQDSDILSINSHDKKVTERFLLHGLRLSPTTIKENVHLFWYQILPKNTFYDFGTSFRDYLAKVWSEAEVYTSSEHSILTFDISNCKTQEEFYRKNLALLINRNIKKKFVIILDVRFIDNSNLKKILDVKSLIDIIKANTPKSFVKTIVIGNKHINVGNWENLNLKSIPQDVCNQLNSLIFYKDQNVKTIKNKRHVDENLLKIVHPLVMLNRGAVDKVVNYIKNDIPEANAEIFSLIRNNFLTKLENDGLAISDVGLTFHNKLFNDYSNQINVYNDIVPNGSKILSYQSPEQLLKSQTPFKFIEKYTRSNFKIIDLLSLAITNKFKNKEDNSKVFSLVKELLKTEKLFFESNETHHKIIISYLSQLLIRDKYNLDRDYFLLLQDIVYGYWGYVKMQYSNGNNIVSTKIREASRLVTNLGYVYDNSNIRQKKHLVERREIFSLAAEILELEPAPTDIDNRIDYLYSKGWQYADADKKEIAANIFNDAANLLYRDLIKQEREISQEFISNTERKVALKDKSKAFDLFFLGFIHNNYIVYQNSKDIFLEFMRQYGVFHSIEEIKEFLINKKKYSIGKDVLLKKDILGVYFCKYDFPGALKIAGSLLFNGIACNLNLVENITDLRIEQDVNQKRLIIGAPDTPDGVGEFISYLSPQIKEIYQLKLLDKYGEAFSISKENIKYLILAGCGMNSVEHWNEILSFINKKENIMEPILNSLLFPILKNIMGKVSDKFIDGFVKKMEAKDSGNIISKNELEKLKNDILDIQKLLQNKESNNSKDNIDRFLDFNEKSNITKTIFLKEIQDKEIINTISELSENLRTSKIEIEDAIQVCNLMEAISFHILDSKELSISQSEEMTDFINVYKKYSLTFNDLIKEYKIKREYDKNAFHCEATKMYGTTKEFILICKSIIN